MDDEGNKPVNAIYTSPDPLVWVPNGEEVRRIDSNGVSWEAPHRIILKLTNDGRMELGEGASVDEATQMLFNMMSKNMNNRVAKLVADNERLREALQKIADLEHEDLAAPKSPAEAVLWVCLDRCVTLAENALKEKE